MKVVLGGSCSGLALKTAMAPLIELAGYQVIDEGESDTTEAGTIAAARTVCERVVSRTAWRGILFCGTGVLEGVVCNKVPGIRAAIGHDVHCAHQCVEHSDANVLILGAMVVGPWLAEDLVRAFLGAQFMSTREDFKARLVQLREMEAIWSPAT